MAMRSYLAILVMTILLTGAFFLHASDSTCSEADFKKISDCFANFITCEFTRNDSPGYFEGKPFKITSTTVFDAVTEGDLLIVTGTVTCWVEKQHQILYAVVGVQKVAGYDRVTCLVVRNTDFAILASSLAGYPYKARCGWDRYRVDLE